MSPHTVILAVHIAAGTLGVLMGAAALVFRKGGGPHRLVGKIFVAAMLFMGASASVLAAMTAQTGLVIGGLMTMYFIATAWMAGRRKDGETGVFEIGAFIAVVLLGLIIFVGPLLSAPDVAKPKRPDVMIASMIFSGVLVLAAVGDLNVILRRGIAGAQRIARHLWRMCIGLIIAVGSFAAQGASVLPRGTGLPVLLASMFIIFVVMFYWLVRVLFTNWVKPVKPVP